MFPTTTHAPQRPLLTINGGEPWYASSTESDQFLVRKDSDPDRRRTPRSRDTQRDSESVLTLRDAQRRQYQGNPYDTTGFEQRWYNKESGGMRAPTSEDDEPNQPFDQPFYQPSTVTNKTSLFGLPRSEFGFANLQYASINDAVTMQFLTNLLTNVSNLVVWVHTSDNTALHVMSPNRIEMSDDASNRRQVDAASVEYPYEEVQAGSSNRFIEKPKTMAFIGYYRATRQSGVVPNVYGVRISERKEAVTDIAVEMALTLKMAEHNIAPIVYGFYIKDLERTQDGQTVATAVYLTSPGKDLAKMMDEMHERSEVDLEDAHADYPELMDSLGRQLLELIQRVSQQRVLLGDIKSDNMVVLGLDLDDPTATDALLRLIDFDPVFTAEISDNRADYNCIFVLNALLFINYIITMQAANPRASKTSHEMIVRLLAPLITHYQTTLQTTVATSSSMINELCHNVLKAAKSSPLMYSYTIPKMHHNDTETQTRRVLERIINYGNHDAATQDNGMRPIMSDRVEENLMLRLSKRLLKHFELLKAQCDLDLDL